jgi:hypothetical protein
MTADYCWVKLSTPAHYRRMWKLTPNEWSSTNLGMLAEGYTRDHGWHIIPTAYAPPVATLPRTMSRDEAMTVAKTILLSQRDSHDQQL